MSSAILIAGDLQQLVHERDVHAAEDVLEQLCHLRSARRGDGNHGVDEALEHLDGQRGTRRSDAADDLGRVAGLVDGVARVDALGRERQVQIDAGLHACRLKNRLYDLLGCAGVRRRLESDEHALAQVRHNGLRCGLHV
jgi:hypothetical protein